MQKSHGAFIVSWDFSHAQDKHVLLVGCKKPGKDVEVINAFQGEDARAVYDILTDKKKVEVDSDG